ncbi:IS110 family transposase [Pantanalinema rosaneae CENA516]|uniref:IS110 family transposase n=1 Tax=Pantanalinema rosaneae TaxID=1620701 RepID=UPI003D6EBE7A
MTRVAGIDIGNSSAVVCSISERPENPRSFFHSDLCNFQTLNSDTTGLQQLLSLNLEIAVLEPTGVHYSRLWSTFLINHGVKVVFVGHNQLKTQREHLNLSGKSDQADALALACYYFDYQNDPTRFLQIRTPEAARIRELVLQLENINRAQSPIINRLRQGLAHEFPEIAKVKSQRPKNSLDQPPPLWAWLAGREVSKNASTRYNNLLQKSVGLGVTHFTKVYAEILCTLSLLEIEIENELYSLLDSEEFVRYRQVFAKFGFGPRVQAVLMSQIFPFEHFLTAEGKAHTEYAPSTKSSKTIKKHFSLRKFKHVIGFAPVEKSSGKKKEATVSGSALCRKAIWQWVFTMIEPRRTRSSVGSEIVEELGSLCDQLKANGTRGNIRIIRSKVSAKAATLLFRELLKVFSKP